MSGVGLQLDWRGMAELQVQVNRMAHLDKRGLMDAVGTEVESQFRRRITEEKTSPDGKPWPAWSPAYAATRHSGQSLLEAEGHLRDSMTHVVAIDGSDVDTGSNLIYARIQNDGGAEVGKPGLPAREYAGLSIDNRRDLVDVISDWMEQHWIGGPA